MLLEGLKGGECYEYEYDVRTNLRCKVHLEFELCEDMETISLIPISWSSSAIAFGSGQYAGSNR